MKLNAPKKITWLISIVLLAAAFVLQFCKIGPANLGFWAAAVSAAVLLLSTVFAGL